MEQEPRNESSLRYFGWRVVAACFLMAMFTWGFTFYGHSIYLVELRQLHGWSTSLIAGASTVAYLLGSISVIAANDALERLGPRRFVLLGVITLAAATALLPFVSAPWQLYVVYILMSSGWLTMGIPAITTIVSYWFEARRGLAISLALNGASFGGILVAPALVFLIEATGFTAAMLFAAAVMLTILVPSTLLWVDRPPNIGRHALDESLVTNAAPALTRAEALRSFSFWTVAAAFALALLAQVGFLVHVIAFLEPVIGRAQAGLALVVITVMAVIGRLGLGTVIDRLDVRRATAMMLVAQAAALFLMTQITDAKILLAACAFYGLAVGNLITLPALVVHREFPPAAFGMLIGLVSAIMGVVSAFGPGLVGLARDATGSYTAGIGLCIALALAAAGIILLRPNAGDPLSRP